MLQFGLSFSTLVGVGPDPVEFARRAEAGGFDFVSASDHPATQTASHETWTTLTWMLAATTRLKVASRVLAVPLRSPALVAKMAETQSRLSGGRFVLGLGGGYGDEELRAYGMPVPSAGEKIAGLADAVAIARGLWAEPSFTYAGARYSTAAAPLEPKPEAPIPIWLGTFGPRALALTGRVADGWIPSYGFAPPPAIPALRERIDAGAREAGRDPGAVDFIYHLTIAVTDGASVEGVDLSGAPADLAERLAGLRESLGCTGFSLAPARPDSVAQLDRLAVEVVPAVRRLVG